MWYSNIILNGIMGINSETVSGGYRAWFFRNSVNIEGFRIISSFCYRENFEGAGKIKQFDIIEDKYGDISGLAQLIFSYLSESCNPHLGLRIDISSQAEA